MKKLKVIKDTFTPSFPLDMLFSGISRAFSHNTILNLKIQMHPAFQVWLEQIQMNIRFPFKSNSLHFSYLFLKSQNTHSSLAELMSQESRSSLRLTSYLGHQLSSGSSAVPKCQGDATQSMKVCWAGSSSPGRMSQRSCQWARVCSSLRSPNILVFPSITST